MHTDQPSAGRWFEALNSGSTMGKWDRFADLEKAGATKKALQELRHIAESGDCAAVFTLGQELGVYAKPGFQDYQAALGWFEVGAALGDGACCYEAGVAYLLGLGTAVDISKGKKFVNEAAGLGNEMAIEAIAGEIRSLAAHFPDRGDED